MIIEQSTIKLTAVYNESKSMRYSLKRTWNDKLPSVTIIMSNAPKANDITMGDLTSLLIQNNLSVLGYGSVTCVNLFSFMCQRLDLSGSIDELTDEENLQHILQSVQETDVTIVAIGSLTRTYKKVAVYENRLFEALRNYQDKIHVLTAPDGSTGHHPLSAKLRQLGSWKITPYILLNLSPAIVDNVEVRSETPDSFMSSKRKKDDKKAIAPTT